MRRQLQLFLGGRYQFGADVTQFGLRYTPEGIKACMLLFDVAMHTGTLIVTAQHVWTEVTPEVAEFDPHFGDRILFDATVTQYYKIDRRGYEKIDYSIGPAENIDLITRPHDDGLAFSDYWGNVKQSHLFKRVNEASCTA